MPKIDQPQDPNRVTLFGLTHEHWERGSEITFRYLGRLTLVGALASVALNTRNLGLEVATVILLGLLLTTISTGAHQRGRLWTNEKGRTLFYKVAVGWTWMLSVLLAILFVVVLVKSLMGIIPKP